MSDRRMATGWQQSAPPGPTTAWRICVSGDCVGHVIDHGADVFTCHACGAQPNDERKARPESSWSIAGGTLRDAQADVEFTIRSLWHPIIIEFTAAG